jgi:hypothetical protein
LDTRAVSRSEMSNFSQDQGSQGLVRLWRGCAETYTWYVAQTTPQTDADIVEKGRFWMETC